MPATVEAAAVTAAYRQQLLALRDSLTEAVVARFDVIDFDRLDTDAQRWVSAIVPLVTLVQADAARMSHTYLDAYLRASGIPDPHPPSTDPAAYAGTGQDGRPLDTIYDESIGTARWQLGRGAGRVAAVTAGLGTAVRSTRSAVQHAARAALTDRFIADHRVLSWRRVVSLRPCGACLSLAGTEHPKTATLKNHPSCRCTAEPVVAGLPERFPRPTGQQMYDRLTSDERIRLFAGTGGAAKAELVDQLGVGSLAITRGDDLIEVPLKALASSS